MTAPSAYAMEQAMSALMSARARIAADGELIDDATGEILDVTRVEEDAYALLDATLRAAAEADSMGKMAGDRADAMRDRQSRYKARSEALRGAAFAAMDALGLSKRELPDLLASIAKGTPQVVITDESLLPAHCLRTVPATTAPDKVAIAANLKAGIDVPGAELNNGFPRLQLRTR